jgi:surfactin synthase thioesterase subunit
LIQLPGRENRFDEPAIDRVEWLVGQLMDGLTPYLDRPFAFFGHSMGALIAFELARRLDVIGLEPVHFFASGYHAPHLPGRSPVRHHLPDREFITAIRNLDGVPIEVQRDGELLEMMLPTLRSDFRLAETYAYVPRPPLRCAVTAFGGLEDKEVTPDEIKAWSLHTTGPFEMHVLPGGHFFLRSCRASLLRLVSSNLRASAKVTWAGDVKMGSREARRFRG